MVRFLIFFLLYLLFYYYFIRFCGISLTCHKLSRFFDLNAISFINAYGYRFVVVFFLIKDAKIMKNSHNQQMKKMDHLNEYDYLIKLNYYFLNYYQIILYVSYYNLVNQHDSYNNF